MNFNSHTDRVVAVCVDLVNVATPGTRQGRPYSPPTALRAALGDALGRSPALSDIAGFVAVAAQLRQVFELVERREWDDAAGTVNDLLAAYRPAPVLERHDDEPWHLHFHGPSSDPAGSWGGSCAVALATVLGGEYADRLGVCSAPSCDRVYVDTSRNGTRRFCSLRCQSRVKTAAYRARS